MRVTHKHHTAQKNVVSEKSDGACSGRDATFVKVRPGYSLQEKSPKTGYFAYIHEKKSKTFY